METLAGELGIAVENARVALAEARGTEFEAYLSKLVEAGERALAEVSTRGVADLRELIAALNEGARATTLTLNGRKQLAARKAEGMTTTEVGKVVETKATQDKPVQTTIKAEVIQANAEPRKMEVAQVEAVETRPIEVAKEVEMEEVLVPNTSAVEVAGASAIASEWGAAMLVLLTMVVALGILAVQRVRAGRRKRW